MKNSYQQIVLALMAGLAQPLIAADIMDSSALAEFPNPPADHVISYGSDDLQFGELRLPQGEGPFPLMVFIHGGCWLAEYDVAHARKLAAAFTAEGIATWLIEYRRVGDKGGGWPGTFDDVAAAMDKVSDLAEEFPLDTDHLVVAGHSAGGHLAIWLANRPVQWGEGVSPTAVLAMAPAADLVFLDQQHVCGDVVEQLMGGTSFEVPERYEMGSGSARLPLPVPQWVVLGAHDEYWLPVGKKYVEAALASDGTVHPVVAADSGHFEMIDPDSSTWPLVLEAAKQALEMD
jgi:acetyl esterase/lipase